MSGEAKRRVQQNFGTHAANYVAAEALSTGYSLDRLAALLAPQPGWWVLDVATGGGHTARRVAQSGANVIAADLTGPMLLAARAFIASHGPAAGSGGVVRYARLDAEQLPFAAGTFDAVTCRIAPHHFPHVAQFVTAVARVLKPGGVFGLVDQLSPPKPEAARYINAFERLRDPGHVWAYNRAEWHGFVTGAGLRVAHFETFDTRHLLGAWAHRMGCNGPTILRLHAMLVQAPDPVAAWMTPHLPPQSDPVFSIRQFLMIARK